MARVLDEHLHYLTDQRRILCYERALRQVVRPGDTVLDLGCGTGILGLLALRAGASRVYAVDTGGILSVAERVARLNGVAHQIVHIVGASTAVTLPDRVDVVICDQLGPTGFEAGLLRSLEDARARHVRPDGRFMPGRVESWFAPASRPGIAAHYERWNHVVAGFSFAGVRADAVNDSRTIGRREEGCLLAPGQRGFLFVAGEPGPLKSTLSGHVSWEIEHAGQCHGLQGWFRAALSEDVDMTNAPDSSDAIDRVTAFLGFEHPLDLEPGDLLSADLVMHPSSRMTGWRGTVTRGGCEIARFDHSTLRGQLVNTKAVS